MATRVGMVALSRQYTLVHMPLRPRRLRRGVATMGVASKTAVIVNGDECVCLYLRGESAPHSRSVTIPLLYNIKRGADCAAV